MTILYEEVIIENRFQIFCQLHFVRGEKTQELLKEKLIAYKHWNMITPEHTWSLMWTQVQHTILNAFNKKIAEDAIYENSTYSTNDRVL